MIRIDSERIEVIINGRHIRLTPKEFGILKALKKANGRVLSRKAIFYKVWGYDELLAEDMPNRTVDQCLSRIRSKIGKVSRQAAGRIITVPKHGYKLARRNRG